MAQVGRSVFAPLDARQPAHRARGYGSHIVPKRSETAMKPQWILIANASHARLFQQEADGHLTPLESFEHPASRQRSSALGDDKAGRELSGRGFGGAAFEPHIDAQRKEHLEFARELGERLERGAQQGLFESVTLFASSPFLGELKQALGAGAQRLLAGAHDVDLTAVGLAELQQRIQHELSQAA